MQIVSVPFLIQKHPILPKLDAFYNNLLKKHPGSFISDHPLNRSTKFCEKTPQKAGAFTWIFLWIGFYQKSP